MEQSEFIFSAYYEDNDTTQTTTTTRETIDSTSMYTRRFELPNRQQRIRQAERPTYGQKSSLTARPDEPKSLDADVITFYAVVTPLSSITTERSDLGAKGVKFMIHRVEKVVVLQWESFQGKMSESGRSELVVNQSIAFHPPQEHYAVIAIYYKSKLHLVPAVISSSTTSPIKILLSMETRVGDFVHVPAGSISWIL